MHPPSLKSLVPSPTAVAHLQTWCTYPYSVLLTCTYHAIVLFLLIVIIKKLWFQCYYQRIYGVPIWKCYYYKNFVFALCCFSSCSTGVFCNCCTTLHVALLLANCFRRDILPPVPPDNLLNNLEYYCGWPKNVQVDAWTIITYSRI